jgi:hypothetical protein
MKIYEKRIYKQNATQVITNKRIWRMIGEFGKINNKTRRALCTLLYTSSEDYKVQSYPSIPKRLGQARSK